MNGRLTLLGGLLLVQVLVIAVIAMLGRESDDSAAFISLDVAAVSSVRIEGEQRSVELKRADGRWSFGDGTPADGKKIDAALEKLSKASGAWPVATTAGAQTRFEVTEEQHQRKLTITSATGPIEFYLGTSPGYRRVHARHADKEEIYSIDFANHELPLDRDEWLDKTLLKSTDVTSIALTNGWTLKRSEQGWLVNGQAANAEAVQQLVDRIEGLRVMGFAGEDLEGLEPARKLDITDAAGSFQLTLAHDTKADEYLVDSDRVEGRFTLASYIAEQILLDTTDLLAADTQSAPGDEPGDTESAEQSPDREITPG